MVNVAIFVRDAAGESAKFQRDRLERYCRRRHWRVVGVYQHPPTALTADGRPRGRVAALKDGFDRKFKAIVLWRLSALGNNVNGLVVTLAFTVRHGIRIVAVGDRIDTGRSRTAAKLLVALAKFELATNRRSGCVLPRDPCEGCPCRPEKRPLWWMTEATPE